MPPNANYWVQNDHMPAYLITGPNGSGKSTIGQLLATRGYQVIEMDAEPGLSGWIDTHSGERITVFPPHPFSEQWMSAHSWVWFKDKFDELIVQNGDKTIFFCGGAYNQREFYDFFNKRFTLYLDDSTTIRRLRAREPERWKEGSAELKKTLDWNAKSKQISAEEGSIMIDGSKRTETIVDYVLSIIDSDLL